MINQVILTISSKQTLITPYAITIITKITFSLTNRFLLQTTIKWTLNLINPYTTIIIIFCCLFNSACTLEQEDKNSFNMKGDIYQLEGELTLTADDNEDLILQSNLSTSSQQQFSFRQKFYTGDNVEISITKQPRSQYCRFIRSGIIIGEKISTTITDQDFDEIIIDCQSYSRTNNNPESLSADDFHTCLIDNAGARCLGKDQNMTNVTTGLVNPRKITSSDTHGCVIDDSGVVCWGVDSQEVIPSNLSNPKEIKAGSGFSCALDDMGLKCWGWDLLASEVSMNIENATNLSVGRASACVLDNGKPICKANDNPLITNVPDILNHVTSMTLYQSTACAIQDKRLYCWGDWVNPDSYGIELNTSLSQIYLGKNTHCLANEETVACTDQSSHHLMEDMTKVMPNATSIELGIYHICAMNDDDTVCFGSNLAHQKSILLSNQPNGSFIRKIGYELNKNGANRFQLAPFLDQMINQKLRFLRNTFHGQLDTTLRINV